MSDENLNQNMDEFLEKWIAEMTQKAQSGDAEAQYELGWGYLVGEGVEKNPVQAEQWFLKAAEQGCVKAQCELAWWYRNRDDLVKAAEWWRKAADQGDANAQVRLAACYMLGHGVEKDLAQAAQWYQKAAEQGDEWAQFKLVDFYANGIGVECNPSKAIEWLRKAAKQGDGWSQDQLKMYGLSIDGEDPFNAADQGNADAQYSLGRLCQDGFIMKDPVKAAEWYQKAAEQGLPEAQYSLGVCYANGDGVGPDFDKAVEWLQKAADQGDEDALELLEEWDAEED